MKEELEEKEKFVCEVLNYQIFATKTQYCVFYPPNKKKDGSMTGRGICGYYRSLSDALSDIRQEELRLRSVGGKTLDNVIEKLKEFNDEFNKLLKPLKKLEEL
jgi:hypothetical protein